MRSGIKKFKNGNINIKLDLSNDSCYLENGKVDIDKFYYNELNMNDLYFNQINGGSYLVDFNTNLVYDFTICEYGWIPELRHLENELIEGKGFLKLYSLGKRQSKSLLQDLENGY